MDGHGSEAKELLGDRIYYVARDPRGALEACERGLIVVVSRPVLKELVNALQGRIPRDCVIIVENDDG